MDSGDTRQVNIQTTNYERTASEKLRALACFENKRHATQRKATTTTTTTTMAATTNDAEQNSHSLPPTIVVSTIRILHFITEYYGRIQRNTKYRYYVTPTSYSMYLLLRLHSFTRPYTPNNSVMPNVDTITAGQVIYIYNQDIMVLRYSHCG